MFIRIDDVNDTTLDTVKKVCEIFSLFQWTIFLSIIPSQIQKGFFLEFQKYPSIRFLFHWWQHTREEFISDIKTQSHSFFEAQRFCQEAQCDFFWFCPPYNSFSRETLSLLKENNYKHIHIDYKSFDFYQKQKNYDFRCFQVWCTRYFFNKKNEDTTWYIDEKEKIQRDIAHIQFSDTLGIEIHPQYICTQEDWDKLRFLSTLILWK